MPSVADSTGGGTLVGLWNWIVDAVSKPDGDVPRIERMDRGQVDNDIAEDQVIAAAIGHMPDRPTG